MVENKKKYATTFGSSTIKSGESEYVQGVVIGSFLSKSGFVVKCGGYGGLMEAVSKGVFEVKGECIGVCVEYFEDKRDENPYITNKIVAKDLIDRLRILIEDSSLFVIQKGSIGTLNELFLVWCLEYTEMIKDAKIVVIGEDFNFLKEIPMIPQKEIDRLIFFNNSDEFIEKFETLGL